MANSSQVHNLYEQLSALFSYEASDLKQGTLIKNNTLHFHFPVDDKQQELTKILTKFDLTFKQDILTHKSKHTAHPNISNIIAIGSGKGGVGKSTVTYLIAQALIQQGARVGILDADIYGPSQTLLHQTTDTPKITDNKMNPIKVQGAFLMSIALICSVKKAMMWRGPMIAKAITQMYQQTLWPQLDYLLIDLPPGTGDVPISICQNLPLTGHCTIRQPHPLTEMDAIRYETMMEALNIPRIIHIENHVYPCIRKTKPTDHAIHTLSYNPDYQKVSPIGDTAVHELARSMAIQLCTLPVACHAFSGFTVKQREE
ncbi:Mrp/NBP35 family ATP-binding protein [Candidatus Comchoanobacter bicostacola]|uniref:Mrp/NBP35 family ATP-binding protein n=1 Tax=Candidatus Comchoanobacter bicostacola TaxID=2919598 RepID=A0ABY5DIU7_9GAMM|nr:Mrp/NBP35 family ATP-binding protein [Candidatus Comchoanobacter bicostacola]UTC24498.1 Mrp/NBP35 family ATP-binding protein [Candidatus Comchoanobacter bicostacola]